MIDFAYSHLSFGIAILAIGVIFLAMQKRNRWSLLSFGVFGIYLLFVVRLIVLPIAPIPVEDWETFRPSINLVPFDFGSCTIVRLCLRNIAGNILLTIPLGFGISFDTRLESKHLLWLGLLVGLGFEATQLVISLIFRSAFRTTDINDMILNAIGVWLGYSSFKIFGYLYLLFAERFKARQGSLFAHIYAVIRRATAR